MYSYVRLERHTENPAIAILTIDRPPRNAMSLQTYRELLAVLQETHLDDSVRSLILTGAGDKSFVAGGDLHEHAQLDPESALVRTSLIRKVFDAVRRHQAPVIAAVNGYCIGGGLALMASCDIVVASTNATFSLPEVKVGIMGGAQHVRRLVPDKVVRWMALTGNFVDADYFHRLGVIHQVVPPSELMAAALQVAQDICRHGPMAIRLMKDTINLTEHMPLDEGYQVECLATSIIKSTAEAREATSAALERRKPVYSQA